MHRTNRIVAWSAVAVLATTLAAIVVPEAATTSDSPDLVGVTWNGAPLVPIPLPDGSSIYVVHDLPGFVLVPVAEGWTVLRTTPSPDLDGSGEVDIFDILTFSDLVADVNAGGNP